MGRDTYVDFDKGLNFAVALVAELTARGIGRVGVIGNASALRNPRPFRDLVKIGQSLNARYVVIGQVQRDGDRVRLLAHPERRQSLIGDRRKGNKGRAQDNPCPPCPPSARTARSRCADR